MSRQVGTHEIPRKFSGENRFLKLTAKALGYTCLGILLWVFSFKALNLMGLNITGHVIGFMITLLCFLLGTIKIPNEQYIYAGGEGIDILIFYIMRRKFSKVIYTSVASEGED
ncbi:hypothetical protein [Wukongibacter baidiensis]